MGLLLQDKGKRGCRTLTVASSIWHPPPLTADGATRSDEATSHPPNSTCDTSGQVLVGRSWDDKEWGRGYEEAVFGTSACLGKRSECLIFRPVVAQQHMEAVAEDVYQDAMGETRADRSDNVPGNWSQVNFM